MLKLKKTCYLDPESIIEDNKIGEGGFGIVYSGLFEGNQVAIKYMKTISQNNQEMEEFNKEVSMLDKFRSDYIVHFYGVVVTHNKICMVTELAQYGSLQDLIKTKEKVSRSLRIKMLTDAAKGILYLHNNGILHRDIKPDNVLVTSLSNNILVNAKLTDFGSSRNVNMLMTNMTFTKGIGTPIYMAPEVLRQKKI
ncbi:Tyrosine protein kinase TXK [Entamoeba marina]